MILTGTTRRRRISLTPMIDVVFLLLIFFMLAARFGIEDAIELDLAGAAQAYDGPPRLLEVHPDEVRLNGVRVDPAALVSELEGLTSTRDDVIVLRSRDGASVQRLVDLMGHLRQAGFATLVLAE